LLARKRPQEALDIALKGFAVYPDSAELCWAMGAACFDLGDTDRALSFAARAVDTGLFKGRGAHVHRSGYVYPPALWESPFDLMAVVAERLGDTERAHLARALYEQAKDAREAA
jgi:hypothetical protein